MPKSLDIYFIHGRVVCHAGFYLQKWLASRLNCVILWSMRASNVIKAHNQLHSLFRSTTGLQWYIRDCLRYCWCYGWLLNIYDAWICVTFKAFLLHSLYHTTTLTRHNPGTTIHLYPPKTCHFWHYNDNAGYEEMISLMVCFENQHFK